MKYVSMYVCLEGLSKREDFHYRLQWEIGWLCLCICCCVCVRDSGRDRDRESSPFRGFLGGVLYNLESKIAYGLKIGIYLNVGHRAKCVTKIEAYTYMVHKEGTSETERERERGKGRGRERGVQIMCVSLFEKCMQSVRDAGCKLSSSRLCIYIIFL